MKRLLNLFHQEFKGVHQAAFLLAVASILAKILALFRDRLLASSFGAGETLDIYFASFRIPDFIYTLTLFIAASTAIIPILLEKYSTNEERAKTFMGQISVIFFIGTIVLVSIIFFLLPLLVPFITPGFEGESRESVILLSRILLLSTLLLGLSNLASSVIQSFRRFFVYALSPIFYNVGIIIGIVVFYPIFGIAGLGLGVGLGATLHFLIQIPSLARLGFWPHFHFRGLGVDLWKVVKLSFPRTAGLGLNQIVLTMITAIASTLGAGSIAIFSFAQNLQSVPLSIIGVSYSVAAFPTLSRLYVGHDRKDFLSNIFNSIRHIIFWSVPAVVLFIVLRAQIVRVILGAGAFGWVDTRLTSAALMFFSFSILSQSLVMLYVRAFYAAGRTILPLIVNFISSAITIGGSYLLINIYRHSVGFKNFFSSILRVEGVEGGIMLILPLAFTLGSIINVVLLGFFFNKIFKNKFEPNFYKSVFQISLAGLALGSLAYISLQIGAIVFNLQTFLGIFFQGLFSTLLGIFSGGVTLWFLKNREFLEIKDAVSKKFWKTETVSQEPESLM